MLARNLEQIFRNLCEMKFRYRIHMNSANLLASNPNRMNPGNETPGHIFPFLCRPK